MSDGNDCLGKSWKKWVEVPRAGLRDEDSYLLEPGRTITGFDG